MPSFFQEFSEASESETNYSVLYALRLNKFRLSYEVRRNQIIIAAIMKPETTLIIQKLMHDDLPAIIQQVFTQSPSAHYSTHYSTKRLDENRIEEILSIQKRGIFAFGARLIHEMMRGFERSYLHRLGTISLADHPAPSPG